MEGLPGADSFVGHHSGLFGRSNESDEIKKTVNVDYLVNYWIDNGMDAEKINLGLAFFGRTFKLMNVVENVIGSPAKGPGSPGNVINFCL